MSRRIILNLRGVHFETYEETLARFPNTLLGNSNHRKSYWNDETDEFVFDRSHHLFDSILFFYQSGGILAKPECFDEDEFQRELRFFGIIKEQSQLAYAQNKDHWFLNFLKLLTDYPSSSISSKLFAAFSMMIIIISTITYCMETEVDDLFSWQRSKLVKLTGSKIESSSSFFVCETTYVCWFALEYVLRFIGNQSRMGFILSPLGFVDLLSIFPFVIIASGVLGKCRTATRVLKFLQIFRILKISRYSDSLKLLGRSLFYCKGQISLLLIFFFINCLACGSVLYWVERTISPSPTASLMDTIWFCIVSMTTVGYGDIVPRTSLGKVVGSVTILAGIVILFHIFIPVYLSYFALLYEISILQSLEQSQNGNALDQEEPDAIKSHRRKSISSSVRKSRTSVAMTRSPSTCLNESAPVNSRKLSITMREDSIMRKVKYDYLKKLSSTESPLAMSQKSLEASATDGLIQYRKGSLHRKTTGASNETIERKYNENVIQQEDNVFFTDNLTQCPGRSRRQAVYEQPILTRDLTEVSVQSQINGKNRYSYLQSNDTSKSNEGHRKLSLTVSHSSFELSPKKSASTHLVFPSNF